MKGIAVNITKPDAELRPWTTPELLRHKAEEAYLQAVAYFDASNREETRDYLDIAERMLKGRLELLDADFTEVSG